MFWCENSQGMDGWMDGEIPYAPCGLREQYCANPSDEKGGKMKFPVSVFPPIKRLL